MSKIKIEDLQPYFDRCVDVLDPRHAGILGDRQAESLGISLNKEGVVRRLWRGLDEKMVYRYKAFLDFFTDVSNVADSQTPCSWVKDPKVGDGTNGEVIAPGTYRQAYTIVRPMADDKYDLIQELRLGWIESLVSGSTVDWSEARVEGIDWFTGDNGTYPKRDFITVVWKGVSPYHSEAIVESLRGLGLEGWTPVVNGNDLGSHMALYFRAQEENDGSHSVRGVFGNSRLRYAGVASYGTERQGTIVYHFGVPSELVPSIVDAEDGLGVTVRISPPDNQGLHTVTIEAVDPEANDDVNGVKSFINCSQYTYTYMRLGVTADTMESFIGGVVAEEDGLTWVIRRESRGDGYWNVIVEKRETRARSTERFQAEFSDGRDIWRRKYYGQKEDDLPDLPESVPGKVVRRDIDKLEDCTVQVQDEEYISKPLPTEQTRKVLDATVSTGSGTRNILEEDIPPEVDPERGEIKTRRKVKNPDGSFDIDDQTDTSLELPNEESIKTVKQASLGEGVENDREDREPTEPEIGKVVRFRKRQNQDKTWTWTEVIEESPNNLGQRVYELTSCRELSSTEIERNIREDLSSWTPESPTEPGVVKVVRLTENLDGSWDREIITRTAPDGLEAESRSVSPFETVTIIRKQNEATGLDLDAEVDGAGENELLDVSNTENEDCSYDTDKRVTTPVEFTSDEITVQDGTIRIKETSYVNHASPPSPGAGDRLNFSLNRFALWDGKKANYAPGSLSSFTFTTYSDPFKEVASSTTVTEEHKVRASSAAAAKRLAIGTATESDLEAYVVSRTYTAYKDVRWKYVHTISIVSTLSEAEALLSESVSADQGSGITPILDGVLWQVHVIIKTKEDYVA